MSTPRLRLLALAGLVLAILVTGPAHAAPVSLPGSVLRGLANARDLGRVPAASTVSIGVGLQGRNDAARDRLVAALYDRRSASYHRFLTPAAYRARFGTPAGRVAATVRWLRAGGLRITRIPSTSSYVLASGPAARVQALLGTRLDAFAFRGHRYFANVTAPHVPAALHVLAVTGLNDFEGPRLLHRPAAARPQVPQLPSALSPGADTGLTTPQDLWSIYDQPAADKGDGQRMAIFGWGTTKDTEPDLRLFERERGLPTMPLTINYYGSEKDVTDSGGEVEWDLDTQASTGMAPNAVDETLYFGKAGTDADLVGAYNAWANQADGALQGSSSFSGCEQAPGTDGLAGSPGSPQGDLFLGNPNQALYEAALTQAVAEGRTMFASSGDTGAGCPASALELNGVTIVPTVQQGYPAVSPHAVGVGGTVLYFDDATATSPADRAFEYSWTHTGGGSSLFLAAPSWQQSVVKLQCVSQPDGTPYSGATPCRGVPDVAAQSGDIATNGYAITEGGAPDQSGGGTSLSSPLWLGMWTRIQAAQADAAGNGFAAPALYAQQGKGFFDVGGTSGDTAPTCNGEYCSTPGWDYTSGWGSPDVKVLAQAISGSTTPARTTTIDPPPTVDVGSTASCPGPQLPDKTGDAPNGYPGGDGSNLDDLDIANVAFDTEKAADGSGALGITMHVKNLTGDPFMAAMTSASWDVHWTAKNAAGTEVAYDAQVVRDLAGPAAQYTFSVSGSDGSSAAETGVATPGGNGTLHWTIDLADIGSPAAGAPLYETFADTRGTVEVAGTGLQYTASADRAPDAGFGAQWPIGTDCAAAAAAASGDTGAPPADSGDGVSSPPSDQSGTSAGPAPADGGGTTGSSTPSPTTKPAAPGTTRKAAHHRRKARHHRRKAKHHHTRKAKRRASRHPR